MALELGELSIKYRVDEDGLERQLRSSERRTEASGQRMGRSLLETMLDWARRIADRWGDAGAQAGERFWRDANGRLRDARGRFAAAGDAAGRALSDGAGEGMRMFSVGTGNLMTGVVNLTTNFWNWIPAILAVSAALLALAPAALLAGGALGAIPALTTGGLAAIGALGLGLMGLAEAFQDTARGGGSAADRLRQVEMAERRVRDANREVLASQLALNRAREDAARRLRDLSMNLEGAHQDEADAIDAVEDARRNLERAVQGGNVEQIDDAQRAYERAEFQLRQVRNRLADLTREHDEATAAGVEGSDEVTAALERQQRAAESLEDAHYDLKRAMQPTGGAATETTRLAQSALDAVAAIKGLKSEFEGLRLEVQERLFAGADDEIRELWAAWLPTLRTRLGSMADMFNGLFKDWAETSKNPEFISNIAAGWEHVERLINRVGKAIAGPGLEAFGKLSRAAGPMLDAIGDKLGGIVENFAAWIDEAEKSGDLQEFFEDAGKFFSDVVDIGEDALSIIGSIISILFRAEDRKNTGSTMLEGFRLAMDDLARWFDNPENQQKVADWFGKLEDFVLWIWNDAIPKVQEWIDKIDAWADRIEGWINRARAFKNGVKQAIDDIVGAITGMPGRIGNAASGMFDGLKNAFRSALNWIIGKWNNLQFSLPGFTFLGANVPSLTLHTPDIPYLKDGGLVRATPGGRLVGVAEAGQDEIVSPVDQMRRIVAEELARVQQERGPMYAVVPIQIGDEVRRVVEVELEEHDRNTKRFTDAGSGRR